MARLARVIAPGCPHHVTQRGNRRQRTFFRDEDYEAYLALMAEWCAQRGVAIWAWCLMPNHVHLVAVPRDAAGRAARGGGRGDGGGFAASRADGRRRRETSIVSPD